MSPDESALHALFTAIASRDRALASRLIERSPTLARRAAKAGATREDESSYYFTQIAHYAYAGDTPLHMAAAAYEPAIAADLISRGADVRATNRRGAQPLHYASDGAPDSLHWNPEAQHAVIELLIRAGADPNSPDKGGVAPIHRAVRTRSASGVRALLQNRADARMKNKSGSTPLHLAVQTTGRGGSGSALSRAQQTEIIQLLLSHGARPSDRNSSGRSVQECAAAWIQPLLRDG
jgi:ankyrin repeat protein